MWIEPVAHLSERTVCACVKWVSVTSRLSCRVFNPHFGTSEFGTFGFRTNSAFRKIRLSETFGKNSAFGKICLRISYEFGHALFSITWIKFEIFIISWLRHCFHQTFVIITYTKNFLKYPCYRSQERNTCKTDRRPQLRGEMNCQKCSPKASAAEQLTWNNVDSH